MRFGDLVLFYIVTGFSLRWISNAAAAGPSAILIWIGACLGFYLPLVLAVLELSSRYPEEGGLYVWTREAFGGFAGFLSAWLYWASNLPYFPSLLYFTAANALFLGGAHAHGLSTSPAYFVGASLIGLAIAAGLNIRGLHVARWLHDIGAVTLWLPALILLALAGVTLALGHGTATPFTAASLVPSTHLRDIIFWSTVVFSVSGAESASMLGEEIENPRRNVPRALLLAGAGITTIYILATIAVMVALPAARIPEIEGVILSIATLAGQLGVPAIVVVVAALITVSGLGQTGAWFAAASRLPFVAGIDRYLPPAFGRLHPQWRTPYISLLVQAVIAAAFIALSQAGSAVKQANDILVSMSIIAFFIPYLLVFAALIRVQRVPTDPGVFRAPGGPRVAVLAASVGFVVTAIAIVLSFVPSPDDPRPRLAVLKIAGSSVAVIACGIALYGAGRARQRRSARAAAPPPPV